MPDADATPEPELADAVRRRVLDLAATVLGALPEADVPTSLARVRQFAPGRRSGAGAVPLATALHRDARFRQQVAAAVRESAAELATALDEGAVPGAVNPVEVGALAYLVRPTGWQALVRASTQRLQARELGAAGQASADELERVRGELATALADLAAAREQVGAVQRTAADELATVRRELRRHRSDADRARAQARGAAADAEQVREQARGEAAAALERAKRAERDLAGAQEALQALRRADREGRSLAGSRARLLLDTLVEAATGLRTELALAPADVLPGDLVGRSGPEAGTASTPARARDEDDPAVLDELLALPRAHLVVDGYNVTKSAYGDLPLVDQRRRLVTGLAALAARTRAEVTCCFDGTALEGRVAAPSVRGVRVLFSEAGESADELIRRLVRAEPTGRVVVVVSSDREVADGVRAAGARPVPSRALGRLLERT